MEVDATGTNIAGQWYHSSNPNLKSGFRYQSQIPPPSRGAGTGRGSFGDGVPFSGVYQGPLEVKQEGGSSVSEERFSIRFTDESNAADGVDERSRASNASASSAGVTGGNGKDVRVHSQYRVDSRGSNEFGSFKMSGIAVARRGDDRGGGGGGDGGDDDASKQIFDIEM